MLFLVLFRHYHLQGQQRACLLSDKSLLVVRLKSRVQPQSKQVLGCDASRYTRLQKGMKGASGQYIPPTTPPFVLNFISGAIAGAVATLITHPPDVLRARLQLNHYSKAGMKHVPYGTSSIGIHSNTYGTCMLRLFTCMVSVFCTVTCISISPIVLRPTVYLQRLCPCYLYLYEHTSQSVIGLIKCLFVTWLGI